MHDDSIEVFSDAIELAVDELIDHLTALEYPHDQVEDLSDLLRDRLESFMSVYMDDIPEPEENDNDSDDEDDDQ